MRGYARDLALNLDEYDQCMQSAMYAGRIQASYDEGSKLGVGSTPTFLIDGRLYPGVLASDSIRKLVDRLTAAATTPQP
jgi:protein-disulfide isomerase